MKETNKEFKISEKFKITHYEYYHENFFVIIIINKLLLFI